MKYLDYKCVLVFFYNIIILSKSPKEYDAHLHLIFNILKQHILHLNSKKYLFAQTITDFLGHQILVEGGGRCSKAGKHKVVSVQKHHWAKGILRADKVLLLFYTRYVDLTSPLT